MSNLTLSTRLNDTAQHPAITAHHIRQFLRLEKSISNSNAPTYFLNRHIDDQLVMGIQAYDYSHAYRGHVESYIKEVFYQHHHAKLNAFMPLLLASTDDKGAVNAAVGIRKLAENKTFLEQYLDQSIDVVIAEISQQPVQRHTIAEVGNLACTSAGISRKIISLLVYYLHAQNIDWAVCTGTVAVRAILDKVGIPFTYIQKADPERLGGAQHSWGSYYKNNPYVLAIDVKQALDVLRGEYYLSTEVI